MEWSFQELLNFELQEILLTPVVFVASYSKLRTKLPFEEAAQFAISFLSIGIMHFFGVKYLLLLAY